jgi:hypothetical protein
VVAGADSAIAACAGVPLNGSARGATAAPTIVARRFFGAAAVVATAAGFMAAAGTGLRLGGGVGFTFTDALTSIDA